MKINFKRYRHAIAFAVNCDPKDVRFLINDIDLEEVSRDTLKIVRNEPIGFFRVMRDLETISEWYMYEFPHCCAFIISCGVTVYPTYRKLGIGSLLNEFRQDIGRLFEYSAILCTDIEQNVPQRKILLKNHWYDVLKVRNKKTENNVFLSVKNL